MTDARRSLAAALCRKLAIPELKDVPFEEHSVYHRQYWMDRVAEIEECVADSGLVIGEKMTYTSATIDTTNLYLVRILS